MGCWLVERLGRPEIVSSVRSRRADRTGGRFVLRSSEPRFRVDHDRGSGSSGSRRELSSSSGANRAARVRMVATSRSYIAASWVEGICPWSPQPSSHAVSQVCAYFSGRASLEFARTDRSARSMVTATSRSCCRASCLDSTSCQLMSGRETSARRAWARAICCRARRRVHGDLTAHPNWESASAARRFGAGCGGPCRHCLLTWSANPGGRDCGCPMPGFVPNGTCPGRARRADNQSSGRRERPWNGPTGFTRAQTGPNLT